MPLILFTAGIIAMAWGLLYGAVAASSARQWFAVGTMMMVGLSLLMNV